MAGWGYGTYDNDSGAASKPIIFMAQNRNKAILDSNERFAS